MIHDKLKKWEKDIKHQIDGIINNTKGFIIRLIDLISWTKILLLLVCLSFVLPAVSALEDPYRLYRFIAFALMIWCLVAPVVGELIGLGLGTLITLPKIVFNLLMLLAFAVMLVVVTSVSAILHRIPKKPAKTEIERKDNPHCTRTFDTYDDIDSGLDSDE